MWTGRYELELVCDKALPLVDDLHPSKITLYRHELGSTARSMARSDGWIIGPKHTLCPNCSGKKKTGG